MSSTSRLLCSPNAKAPGPGSLAGSNYDYGAEVIATGPNHGLAAFWFTLFDLSHLTHHESERHRIPTLVAPRAESLALSADRESWLFDHFPGCEPFWQTWQRFIREQSGAFFKVDATELYHESAEGYFEEQLVAALRWLGNRSPDDFSELLMLSRLVFDPDEKRICFDGQDHVEEGQLCGYFGSGSFIGGEDAFV
jgi:hypothetical protein